MGIKCPFFATNMTKSPITMTLTKNGIVKNVGRNYQKSEKGELFKMEEIERRRLANTLVNLIIFDMFVIMIDFLIGAMI